MIKEALEYLFGFSNTRIVNDGDRVFSTQPLHLVKNPTTSEVNVRSLTGLIEYLQSKFDGEVNLLVHVVSPTEVVAFSSFNRDFNRNQFIKASAMLPEFSFGRFLDTEEMVIRLQAGFVKNDDRDILLKCVGNVKDEAVKTYGDDGVSQTVTAKTGVAAVGEVLVPNPVKLAPYRTFIEIDQPESNFIFRMKSGPTSALFEADGGAWKNEAMKRVKDYLEAALEPEITAGRIAIIA